MEKKMKMTKVKLSEEVLIKLTEVDQTLKERGARGVDIGGIFDLLFKEDTVLTVIDKFVSLHTPTEFKVSQLLNDPDAKKKILDIVGNKEFGLKILGDDSNGINQSGADPEVQL